MIAEWTERRYCPDCEAFLTEIHTILWEADDWNPMHTTTNVSDRDWKDHYRFVNSCPARS